MEAHTFRYVDDVKAAKIMDMSPQTLRNARCQGRGIPYVKIGRSVRYCLDDVMAYMEQHKIVPVNSDELARA